MEKDLVIASLSLPAFCLAVWRMSRDEQHLIPMPEDI